MNVKDKTSKFLKYKKIKQWNQVHKGTFVDSFVC